METKALEYISTISNKSERDLYEDWDKAKALTKHEYNINEADEGFYPLSAGIFARIMRIKRVTLTEKQIQDFIIVCNGGDIEELIKEETGPNREHRLIPGTINVKYVKRDDKGSWNELNEDFCIHEDGDPVFPVSEDIYKNLLGSNVKWKEHITEAIKSWARSNADNRRIWVKCESTGNLYKYIIPGNV